MQHKTKYLGILFTGLLFMLVVLQAQSQDQTLLNEDNIGMSFPELEAETLSGKDVLFPDSVAGKITLLLIAFERDTQSKIDSWLNPFIQVYGDSTFIDFYEIPMISTGWKLIAPIIDGGMRSGVPQARHDHVSTYYGRLSSYKEKLGMNDKSECYLFLLDSRGHIQWQSTGSFSRQDFNQLQAKIMSLKHD
ncbi:MAG: hypothetical protein GF313_05100 [Caldithrix sp.]|nr:hypothetical protein [Caldithrix sp.]